MISKYYILILSLIVCSCANPSNNPNFAEASISDEGEQIENATKDDEQEEISTTNESEELDSNPVLPNSVKKEISSNQAKEKEEDQGVIRKASTIAEQQQAARKIQEQLAARSPMPNEDKILENAVFEKVVTKTEKPTSAPKPSASSKPKAASKPKSTPKKKKGKPAIEFAEMTMEFDTISQGDIIDHDFIFTNTGTAPLEIKTVSVSCGCTRPSYPFIPIEPNEQGRISVSYNSVGKEGSQSPEITVVTNIGTKEIILTMEGFVEVPKKEESSNQ